LVFVSLVKMKLF